MIKVDYLYTNQYENISDFILDSSIYIYGYSPEDRSRVNAELEDKNSEHVDFIKIEIIDGDVIRCSEKDVSLRDFGAMNALLNDICKKSLVYLDVTGIGNREAASLLKSLLFLKHEVKVVYMEPYTYKVENFKLAGTIYNLSEKIDGISPLPGFASIIPTENSEFIFVALLGFEGGRFIHTLSNVDAPDEYVIPVLGLPGFRAEYPFVALVGNRQILENPTIWSNVEYISANSIVQSYCLLDRLRKRNRDKVIKIAPIGTKPHAIGSILYAIKNPHKVEIVYDNPKRKIKRTVGVGLITVTDVAKLIMEL